MYKHYTLNENTPKAMFVEFVNGEEVTCSYLEHSNNTSGLVRTVVLNEDSLKRSYCQIWCME